MSGLRQHKEKTTAELKEFAKVMAAAALIFSLIGYYKRRHYTLMILAMYCIALIFTALGAFLPESLRGFEKRWMAFAEKIGGVMTIVVMLITFYLMITPFGLMMRLFRRDPLSLKIDKSRKSYWEPLDPQGSGSRFFLPY